LAERGAIESWERNPRTHLLGRNELAGRFGAVFSVVVLLLLVLSAGARAAGEYEHNDSRETAFGPLAGGTWYTAGFETDNDVDWFVFYIKTYSQMDFSAGIAGSACCDQALLTLYDKDGKFVDDFFSGELNEVRHLYLTLPAGRYYFEVSYGDTGNRYKFRIDPAASITTSRECGEALVAKEAVVPLLADANQDLAKNAETLATRAEAVHEAKKDLRRASKKAKRLRQKVKRLRRHGPWGWRLRRARAKLDRIRGEVRGAVEGVHRARERRQPVWEERVQLEAVANQHQQEIAGADGQIAAHC